MKKLKTLFCFLLCFNVFFVKAQFIEPPTQTCYHDEFLNQLKNLDSNIQSKLNSIDSSIISYLKSNATNSLVANVNITIPVVVYIIHSGVAINTAENISVNQVLSQINKLNQYFSNTGIQFCLATKNNGLLLNGITPYPGIIRISNTTLTDVDANTEHAALTATSTLPSNRYLRIWVVRSINNGVANGYSILPDVVTPAQDGIVMDYKAFGDQATCGCTTLNTNSQNGKILVHEVGHYFGLYHTFEGGCDGMTTANCNTTGDRVCDTPPVSSSNSGCNVINSCTEIPNLPDDINNYMDYTNETCLNHFTNGQILRMNASIALYKSVMITAANQTYAGINCNGGLLASFSSNNNTPCINTSVTFTANPINGVTSYTWNFGDGTSATGQVVTKTYTTALSPANVTLTISDGTNSASTIQNYYVEACAAIINSESNWYFFNKNAINFSSGVPVYNSSAFVNNTFNQSIQGVAETSAVQSDANGNLLFYTDGKYIWNKNHIPIYTNLLNNYSSLNGVIIVPDPNNQIQYYIFTSYTTEGTVKNGFKYTKVQIDSNNLVSIISSQTNIPVIVPSSFGYDISNDTSNSVLTNESITAVKHSNGYWIVSSAIKNNIGQYFLVFNLTNTGLSFVRESFIGNLQTNIGPYDSRAVNIQVSPNAKKIIYSNNITLGEKKYIFDFDFCNGSFSNQKVITTFSTYGIEFSPNSKLLYVTNNSKILQFDIESCNIPYKEIADISPNSFVGLQRGPNNKIYTNIINSPKITVINAPNNLCTITQPNACNYSYNGLVMQNSTNVGAALPNMIDAKTNPVFSNSILYSEAKCATACYTYNFEADIYTTSYNWNFGDPVSGTTNNTASYRTPSHTFSLPGTYTVTCVTTSGTLNIIIIVGSLPTITGSAFICPQNNMVGSYTTMIPSGYSVVWSSTGGVISGLNNQSNVTINWTTLPGTVTLKLINNNNNCELIKNQSITLGLNTIPTFNAINPICSGSVISSLPTTSTNGITGTWLPAINNSQTTTYIFTPTNSQCPNNATLTITILPITDPSCNSNCPASWIFSTPQTTSNIIYKASNIIVTDTNYIVNSGATIGLRSGNSIVLKPNSQIKQGSNFSAKIQNCNVSGKIVNNDYQNFSDINENEQLLIYPNPFKSEINISVKLDNLDSVEIISIEGKVIFYQSNIQSDNLTFTTDNLQNGIYIVISKTKKGSAYNNKIIKN